jgi:hypothetical protein
MLAVTVFLYLSQLEDLRSEVLIQGVPRGDVGEGYSIRGTGDTYREGVQFLDVKSEIPPGQSGRSDREKFTSS